MFAGSVLYALLGLKEPLSQNEVIQISKDRHNEMVWHKDKTMFMSLQMMAKLQNRLNFTLKAHRLRVDVYPSPDAYFYGRDLATRVFLNNFRLGAMESRTITVVSRVEGTVKTSVISDGLINLQKSCYQKKNGKYKIYVDLKIQPFVLSLYLPIITIPLDIDCPPLFQNIRADMIKDSIDLLGNGFSLVSAKHILNNFGDAVNSEING